MRRSNDQGFTEFVDASMPRLFRVAHALTSNYDDAWDLTQDCLVRVGLKWEHLDHRGSYAYARATLLNLDRNRRRALWRRISKEREYSDAASRENTAFPVMGMDAWLADCLACLSRQQRLVVVLRFVEDLSTEEVADATGLAVSTVKTHQQRAMTHIRAAAVQAGVRSRP